MGKIVTKKEFKESIRPVVKSEHKTIALCHGVFDLVHAGHIIHFEQAKSMADVLVVSITASEYVRKGPGRPFFNDDMRMKFLSSIEYIDYVMLSEGYTVDDIVECVEPDYYVKGQEYADEDADITENIKTEKMLVERHGGQIRFTNGQVFSSTKLINNGLSGLSEEVIEYMGNYKKNHSMDEIIGYMDKTKNCRILVVGDVIIDRYSYCDIQGLMSKDMGYSARLLFSEDYLGGSIAIARHLSGFSNHVTLMSVIGVEPENNRWFTHGVENNIRLELIRSKLMSTIVKQRFLSKDDKREEYHKIFAINNIPYNTQLDKEIHKEFMDRLMEIIDEYDAVFLCDFGHGLIDSDISDLIQNMAKYLVLNCQTNSSNYGLNVITKYKRADIFTVDQRELKLAFPAFAGDEDTALSMLGKHLGSGGFLTRGSKGANAIGIADEQVVQCPALTLTIKDTIGAGDAFYSVSGLTCAVGAPLEVGLFLGNIAGALGANIVGNKETVEKVNVLKYASTLMNI